MGIEVTFVNLFLTIPTFIICRLIFRRINEKGFGQLPAWLATIALMPLVYVGLILTWAKFATYYPDREFEKKIWKSNVEKRYEMTDDLGGNEKLLGKTKYEIKELLGQDGNNFDASQWIYFTGRKPSTHGINLGVLEIKFKHNKVINCWTRDSNAH